MAIDKKKLIILILIGIIAFSLFAAFGEAALKKSDDFDRDGIPNKSDPHPNEARWTDWFGYLGEDGQDLIFGILLFLLLSFIFWFAVGSVFNKMAGGMANEFAIKGIAVTLAGAATIFSYGSPVWKWWRGLFKLSPFIILFIVLALAIMVGVVHFLGVGKQVQKGLKEYRGGVRESVRVREEARAARKLGRRQAWGVERIEAMTEGMGVIERKVLKNLYKLRQMLGIAVRLSGSAQEEYVHTALKEVGVLAKYVFKAEKQTKKIEKITNKLKGYENKELFIEGKELKDVDDLNRNYVNKILRNTYTKHLTGLSGEARTKQSQKLDNKAEQYLRDVIKREQWGRQATEKLIGIEKVIESAEEQFEHVVGQLKTVLREPNVNEAIHLVDELIAIITGLEAHTKELEKIEKELKKQSIISLKEENIISQLDRQIFKDLRKGMKKSKKK